MVKEKKLKSDHGRGFKRTQKQWENSAADHIGKFVDKLTVRDLLYGASFLAGAFMIHTLLPKAENWLEPGTFQIAPFVYAKKETAEMVWVAESLVGSYMLLKIDADDITSAMKKVGAILV
ncbi:hypothetical protein ES705_27037 [subsurface metagenome]